MQIHRAEQGHVPSQLALGDLFYWGARGVPRDQVRALGYFNSAANAGDSTAQCAAAVSSWYNLSCQGGVQVTPSHDHVRFFVVD